MLSNWFNVFSFRNKMSPFEYDNLHHEKKSKTSNSAPYLERPGLETLENTFTFILTFNPFCMPPNVPSFWQEMAVDGTCWPHGFYFTALTAPQQPCCLKTITATLLFSGVESSISLALWWLQEEAHSGLPYLVGSARPWKFPNSWPLSNGFILLPLSLSSFICYKSLMSFVKLVDSALVQILGEKKSILDINATS